MHFGEHQNLFLGKKGGIAIFCWEQGNMHPPWEALKKQEKMPLFDYAYY